MGRWKFITFEHVKDGTYEDWPPLPRALQIFERELVIFVCVFIRKENSSGRNKGFVFLRFGSDWEAKRAMSWPQVDYGVWGEYRRRWLNLIYGRKCSKPATEADQNGNPKLIFLSETDPAYGLQWSDSWVEEHGNVKGAQVVNRAWQRRRRNCLLALLRFCNLKSSWLVMLRGGWMNNWAKWWSTLKCWTKLQLGGSALWQRIGQGATRSFSGNLPFTAAERVKEIMGWPPIWTRVHLEGIPYMLGEQPCFTL